MCPEEMMARIDTRAGGDAAEFVTILMIVAKSLERVQKLARLGEHNSLGVLLQVQEDLFGMAEQLYPEPGEMRRRVLAFADRMGFDLRETTFLIQSHATH